MTHYEYIDEENKVFEIDANGHKELVRSIESTRRAYVRFNNKTNRPVNVWWRDFRGHKGHYVRMKPGRFYDINTFITHPWEFTDAGTNEHYVINNKPIFRAPVAIGGMNYRTNWNITFSVRTLRQIVMLRLNDYLRDSDDVNALELPRALAEELQGVMNELRKPLSAVRMQ